MKNFILIIAIALTILQSCTQNSSSEHNKILVKIYSAIEKNGETVYSDSISHIDSDYAEFELCSSTDKTTGTKKYIATHEIVKPVAGQPFISTNMSIIDDNKENLWFKGSTEFLNYMSERGYQMKSKTERKFCTAYVFEKEK